MTLPVLDSDILHTSYRTLRETIFKYWLLISPFFALILPSVQCDCNAKWLQKHERYLETTHVQCTGNCTGLASHSFSHQKASIKPLICSWRPNQPISSQLFLDFTTVTVVILHTVNCIIPVDSIRGFFSHVSEENYLPIPRVSFLIPVGIKMIIKSK